MGFEIWLLSRLNVEEQAQLFSSAEFIVASHGGGLTNLAFCDPGTKVLEFFPSTYLNHVYCDICMKKGLRYEYIVFKTEEFTGNDLHRPGINVTVDLPALEAKVKALLASR